MMRGSQTKSRPNELAFTPFNYRAIQFHERHRKNPTTQIQRSCVLPFSRDHLSLLYAHCFFDPASSKANSPSSLRFVHQRLKRPPKIFKPTLHSLGHFWSGTLALTTGSLTPKIGEYTVPATSIHPILNPFKLLV